MLSRIYSHEAIILHVISKLQLLIVTFDCKIGILNLVLYLVLYSFGSTF